MGYAQCIKELIKNGDISSELGERLNKAHIDNPIGFKDHINKEQIKAKNNLRKSSLAIQKENTLNMSINPKTAFDDISNLVTRKTGTPSKQMNVEFKIKQVHAKLLTPLGDHFNKLRSKLGGLKVDTKLLDNISYAIFKGVDGSTDNTVNQITKAMDDTLKATNDMATQYGLKTTDDLSKLAPLTNNIQGMTKQEFTDMVSPLTTNTIDDIHKIYKSALDGEEIAEISFKSADALLEYQKKIGGGDPFSQLINYVDRKSAQIASAEVLGKNGKQTLKNLGRKNNLSENEIGRLVNLYEQATGTVKVKIPSSKLGKMSANIISGLRALGTAAMMGSSPLTALLDMGTMGITARYNGIPMMKMYSQMLKNLVSRESRMEMSQLGFQLEAVMSSLSQTSRFNPHSTNSDLLNKMATGVLRTSGLLAFSDATKLAVKNSFLVGFKDMSQYSFKELASQNPRFLKQMKAYNINEMDWKVIQNTTKDNIILNPLELEDTVGSKVFRMINEEADTAIVTPGARSAYWTSLGQDKGTVEGELIKSITQFKSTIVEQFMTHVSRALQQQGAYNKLAYSAQYMIVTTLLGGMVYQLKEAAKGNTIPNPMDAPLDFFNESLKQGGGIPIISDILIPSLIKPEFGRGSPEDILKMASLGTPLRMVKNGVNAVVAGVDGNKDDLRKAEASLAKDLIRMVPGNNIWYIKAFMEYQKSYIGMLLDPKGERKRQKTKESRLKKTNQKSFIQL